MSKKPLSKESLWIGWDINGEHTLFTEKPEYKETTILELDEDDNVIKRYATGEWKGKMYLLRHTFNDLSRGIKEVLPITITIEEGSKHEKNN